MPDNSPVEYSVTHQGPMPIIILSTSTNEGGYSNYFLTGCGDWLSETLTHLFQNLRKSEPISKGFPASKMADFQHIFRNFGAIGPSFLTKMGPLSKDFWWKTNPFRHHIPVSLNMWVPSPWGHIPLHNPYMHIVSSPIRYIWQCSKRGRGSYFL